MSTATITASTDDWLQLAGLIQEILDAHADPTDPLYNACDTDPCEWCNQAAKWRDRIDAQACRPIWDGEPVQGPASAP